MYVNIVAELSEEERQSIRDIVNLNSDYQSITAIKALAVAEHPLCLEEDVQEAVSHFIKLRKAQQATSQNYALKMSSLAHVPAQPIIKNELTTKPTGELQPYPLIELASKWTTDETNRLIEYLRRVDGRKNWSACARFVLTKSSAQCKAKYNNMRASNEAQNRL
ncbi:hypothetical protein GGI07_004459 [Coemansia sp. Benny D115]|nr:hypothetical protein GGI07_004459 [Coemansia sp. Benny D115]